MDTRVNGVPRGTQTPVPATGGGGRGAGRRRAAAFRPDTVFRCEPRGAAETLQHGVRPAVRSTDVGVVRARSMDRASVRRLDGCQRQVPGPDTSGAGGNWNWLQDHLDATGRAAYNMALMSMEEWLENPLYTKLKYLHDIRHEVQAPVVNRDGVIGTLHCGTNDPRGFTPYEVRLTEALGRVAGTMIEGDRFQGWSRA